MRASTVDGTGCGTVVIGLNFAGQPTRNMASTPDTTIVLHMAVMIRNASRSGVPCAQKAPAGATRSDRALQRVVGVEQHRERGAAFAEAAQARRVAEHVA